MINLSENEKRDVIKFLEMGKPLPEKYRFLLFNDDREVELLWNGKTNEVTNVVLPFQTIEQIDEPRSDEKFGNQDTLFDTTGRQIAGWTNKLIWGDNKLILSSLKNGPLRKEIEAQGGLKLIYIDPPFDVGADFSMDIEIGEGDDAESFTKRPSVIEEIAYRDTWGRGADSFIAMIYERLRLMRDLLAEDGSIYVHCDHRLSGYMRLILDEVFGKDHFRNEVIWYYDFGGRSTRFWASKHDTLFFYTKSSEWIFNINDIERLPYKGQLHKYRGNVESKEDGKLPTDTWDIPIINKMANELLGYPTQKPEKLLERIIKASTNKGDLIADFFIGSGTTLAVAEKLGRKWIGTDLGKFGIHTSRKRLIGVQREMKKAQKDFRAFEILNVGRYERESFLSVNDDLRAEEKLKQAERKEKEFVQLIIAAYKAEPITSFVNMIGKKRDRLVAVGPINAPVSAKFVDDIVSECKGLGITKVDVLGFDYEMGLDFSSYQNSGIDIAFRIIPREVFDKKVIEKGQVKFYDVAFIEARPIVKGRGNERELSIELADFSVFYSQDTLDTVIEEMNGSKGKSKIVVDKGQIWKITTDKDGNVNTPEQLTKKWSDWIDYWAVDFDFSDRKEYIRVPKTHGDNLFEKGKEQNLIEYEEVWTGDYIFDNEWQSFRTKKNRNLELVSAPKIVQKGIYKVAVKVVDIFGNDTTKVIEVSV
ncbi:MAG: site-specific DNA-methyltransferase [Candidatus Moraniibacteriota bacterium]